MHKPGSYKPSQEALDRYAADVSAAAGAASCSTRRARRTSRCGRGRERRAPVTELHRLATGLDAALTAAMLAGYAAQRAEIGPRGYEDRIFARKARAKPAVRTLTREAERLLTLRENHRMNHIPEVPRDRPSSLTRSAPRWLTCPGNRTSRATPSPRAKKW